MEKSHKGLYKSHSVSYTKKRVTRMLSMLNHVKPANLAGNALRFNTERDSVTATWLGKLRWFWKHRMYLQDLSPGVRGNPLRSDVKMSHDVRWRQMMSDDCAGPMASKRHRYGFKMGQHEIWFDWLVAPGSLSSKNLNSISDLQTLGFDKIWYLT